MEIKEISVNINFVIIVIVVFTIIIVFALMAYRTYVHKILIEKNRRHQREIQHLKEFRKQQIRVQESERERIAVLLHDDVGSKLNILSLWIINYSNQWT